MTSGISEMKIYRLEPGSETYQKAMELKKRVDDVVRTGVLSASSAQVYKDLAAEREGKALLQATGLLSPVTRVMRGGAELAYPQTHPYFPAGGDDKKPCLYMFVPQGSKEGEAFVPKGATELSGKEGAAVRGLLFWGGTGISIPLLRVGPQKVEASADCENTPVQPGGVAPTGRLQTPEN